MGSFDIDYNDLLNKYAEEEISKWHYIEYPYEGWQPHSLLPLEESNNLVAIFNINGQCQGCFDIESKEDKASRPEDCRYFEIDGFRYDMFNPDEIMKIPLPQKIAFDFDSVPDWFVNEYKKKNDILDYDNEVTLDRENIEILIDRAKELYPVKLSRQEIIELRELFETETELIPDEEIMFWTDFVVLSQDDFINKYPNVREKQVDKTPRNYKSISNGITSSDLYEATKRKGVFEFQKELVIPLSYIAVNLYIANHETSYGLERLIAQLWAVGGRNYAEYLNQRLVKMDKCWSSKESICYGIELREWARNSYEYVWLQNYLPELTPKSKGAYTTSKHKQSIKYQQLKLEAKNLGFELQD